MLDPGSFLPRWQVSASGSDFPCGLRKRRCRPPEGSSRVTPFLCAPQIESTIHAGPRWKLETFLEALSILGEAQAVLEAEECAKGMLKAEALLRVGLAQLVEEFQDALRKSRSEPPL